VLYITDLLISSRGTNTKVTACLNYSNQQTVHISYLNTFDWSCQLFSWRVFYQFKKRLLAFL
jgi:hypothetical protein